MASHLILFVTEGPPNDLGADLSPGMELMVESAKKAFDSVNVFTPAGLISQEPSWTSTLEPLEFNPESGPSRSNASWSNLGGMLWKPRLLMEQASEAVFPQGDTVVYHDANAIKYPEYVRNVSQTGLLQIERLLADRDIVFFRDNYDPMLVDVKAALLSEYVPRRLWLRSHIWSGCLAFRVGETARRVLELWYRVSNIPGALDPHEARPSKVFHWHAADQATLTTLLHCNAIPQHDRARISVRHLHGQREIVASHKLPVRAARSALRGNLIRLKALRDLV